MVRPKWYLRPLQLAPFAALALLIPTPIVGHDSWLHLIWLEQFAGLVQDGVLYPRWLPLSNGGFGSPTFYFYPPLAAYLGSLWALLSSGAREIDLFRFVGYIGTFGSILSFRYYLRKLEVAPAIAWAGGLLYAMLPYRAVDLLLRNALGEHLAFVWIPLVFAGIEGLRDTESKQRFKNLLLIAVGFALLILTNIPTTVAVALAVPFYALLRYEKSWQTALMSIAGLIIGALLVSFYLLPAFTLQDYIQSFHLWDAGTSRTGAAFTVSEIATKPSNPVTNGNFVMLLGGVATLVLAAGMWRKSRTAPLIERQPKSKQKESALHVTPSTDHQRVMIAWGGLLGIALIMQIPGVAGFVYQIPILSYLQFSWRWNLLLVPAIATIFALLYPIKQLPVLASTAVFAITTVAIVVSFNAKYEFHHSPDLLKEEYSDAFEYMPQTTMRSTHALAGFVGKHKIDPPVLINAPGTASLVAISGDSREYEFDLSRPTQATFHVFQWPLWQLEINGRPQALMHDSLGRATAAMPTGRYRASLRRVNHNSEQIGGWISIGVAIILVIGFVFVTRRKTIS